MREDLLPAHPGVLAYMAAFRGGVAFQRGDFPTAIRIWQAGFESAGTTGAVWLAVHLAMMIGSAFANLYDLSTAMEWKEKAYNLAAPTGWPEAIGTSLASMAETTTSLGQLERARVLFEDALPYLDRLNSIRRHVISYNAFGGLCLLMNAPEEALSWFEKGLAIARKLGQPDLELPNGVGVVTALLQTGRLEAAAAMAEEVRRQACDQRNPYYEIEAIRVRAAILRTTSPTDLAPVIEIMEQAIALGDSLSGMMIRSEIYAELARDYEAAGDYRKALAYERRSRESWQRNFDRQNGARIQALQVRFDTARAKAEAEHNRALAEAEATRAAELDHANQTLERLGVIGQEITARLDAEAVFTTLSRHLHDLMPTNTLFVGLKDEVNQIIDIRFRTEDGRRLPPRQVPLASDKLSARCVRDNEEILVAWGERTIPDSVPGTRHMRTVLFRPLALGNRVLGVVSVQSDQPNAYGPRELLIFRTICAYGAIAMANAEAYQQLDRAVGETREALQRLVQQEKMAALGQLVAGVAHEVNTPLGVTLSAVSQLNDSIRSLHGQVEKGLLTRSGLTEALDNGRELAALAQRNVTRAADMIRTFKGVAVDHGSDERRIFELGDYLSEIMSLIRARVAGNGNRIEIDVMPIQMDTYPGALAQVITNLVTNIADHAYAPDRPGRIILRGRAIDAYMVEIAVVDQGCGIPADILPKVFDPFFTTRRAAGSMGLGLHVVFNQVTQRLSGAITIDSVLGQGTVATVRIPREVPNYVPTAFFPLPT
ncbi:ATP-binding protein [Niveispirillum lacus]|uniref:ATP-binding protein n=1 Tax=Niveispirillum lacus TaxID=1981099 RepID=UPI0013FE295B|nr:ATP-binding protein [Niveispirillum lacus]